MKFYLVYEFENGKHKHLRDVWLTQEDAQANAKPIGKSKHWENNGWVDDIHTYEITEMEIEDPTFDIYINHIVREGRRISGLTYTNACLLFDDYVRGGNWVQLQLPLNQFGSIGVTKLKTNEDDEYWEQYNAYWDKREEEERENEYYSPSCPWLAPGCKMSDFI